MRAPANSPFRIALLPLGIVALTVLGMVSSPARAESAASKKLSRSKSNDARSIAAEVDRLIDKEIETSGAAVAPLSNDEDYLRRVTFDLVGTVPSPSEVSLFGLDPDPNKRAKKVDRLLASDAFARNRARYWRDVIFSHATEMRARLAQPVFEDWMAEQLKQNEPWDKIVTDLITSAGDVRENGATALIFAQGGQATEIAAETARIFLGVQMQCANCHDHRTDKWKRRQFHQLAAFFPRVQIRPKRSAQNRTFEVVSYASTGRDRRFKFLESPESVIRRLDRNGDKKLSESEVKGTPLARPFSRLIGLGDTNKDGKLSAKEIKKIRLPGNYRRATAEYYMPDLDDPLSKGTRLDPVFFLNGRKAKKGLSDLERRGALAKMITSPKNVWFARAYVNRVWAEMTGRGFYMPVDDIGPERTASSPAVLDRLADGFVANNYNMKWLFRTIAGTQAYQRQVRARIHSEAEPTFAAAQPTRLRADQLFSALTNVLGMQFPEQPRGDGRDAMRRRLRSPRNQFHSLFAVDPSTPPDDVTGTIPQALFMMNSEIINGLILGNRPTRLARIIEEFPDDTDAISELYLLVLAREPSSNELQICVEYRKKVSNRAEAFEDMMWSLLNSSEFLTKR